MSTEGKATGNTLAAEKLRVGIVAARWNQELVDQMVACAIAEAKLHGVADITVERVDGSGELAAASQVLARSGKFDALVAVGVIIRGGTPHFESVIERATEGLMRVALDEGVPIGDCVIAAFDRQQVVARAGGPGSVEDKGAGAMHAALDLALLKQSYKSVKR